MLFEKQRVWGPGEPLDWSLAVIMFQCSGRWIFIFNFNARMFWLFWGKKRPAAATFLHNFVTLPNYIFIIVNKPLSKLATMLILKLSPSSSGFDEFSQTGTFQKLIKPRLCLLITLIYAKIFRWICFSYIFARHFINPKVHYDDIKWMKKWNSGIWQKRRRKLESDSRPCLKTKTLYQKVQDSENERNTKTKLWDRLQTLRNRHKKLRWCRWSSPPKNRFKNFQLHRKLLSCACCHCW